MNFTRNSDYVIYMQAYNLFALFWLTCFISGLSDMALAGAFASHYWAFRKPQDVPSLPVLAGLGRALRYCTIDFELFYFNQTNKLHFVQLDITLERLHSVHLFLPLSNLYVSYSNISIQN